MEVAPKEAGAGIILRLLRWTLAIFALVFLAPVLISLAIWHSEAGKPTSWHQADWTSAGILQKPSADEDAVIHLIAARTGRWKGAFSVHSWIVMKQKGEAQYQRYEVVGWGKPVRHNAYAADAKWYSNQPEILQTVRGKRAERLIMDLERAIYSYPASDYGSYKIWPGPNSNSFIAYLLNEVPELGWTLPANAVGRDWLDGDKWVRIDPDGRNIQLSAGGYVGFSAGSRHGIEVNFLGLTAGVSLKNGYLKLPGLGKLAFF